MLLCVLVTLAVIGTLTASDGKNIQVATRQTNGYANAIELLDMLPTVNAAIASGALPAWADTFAGKVTAILPAVRNTSFFGAWQRVGDDVKALKDVDTGNRTDVLTTVDSLNSSVMSLVRGYTK